MLIFLMCFCLFTHTPTHEFNDDDDNDEKMMIITSQNNNKILDLANNRSIDLNRFFLHFIFSTQSTICDDTT